MDSEEIQKHGLLVSNYSRLKNQIEGMESRIETYVNNLKYNADKLNRLLGPPDTFHFPYEPHKSVYPEMMKPWPTENEITELITNITEAKVQMEETKRKLSETGLDLR